MKMTKTAAALALAGIAAAPIAQAEVTLTGSVAINLGSSDADDADVTMTGDDSTLNLAASHELNNGLTGYANYRLDSALSGTSTAGDAISVGIKGDFGDIQIGEVPNAIGYGQMAGDILADVDVTQNGGVSYTGSFGSATVGLSWSPAGNESVIGAGVKFSVGGFGIGIGAGSQGTSDDPALSAGVSFAIGGFSIAAAYKDFETSTASAGSDATAAVELDDTGTPVLVVIPGEDPINAIGKTEAISAQVAWSVNDIGLTLSYEVDQGHNDTDALRLDASYALGGDWTTSARVNVLEDETNYRVQFAKSF